MSDAIITIARRGTFALLAACTLSGPAIAEPFSFFPFSILASTQPTVAPEPALAEPDVAIDETEMAPNLRRQIVDYSGAQAPGTIVIDTPNTYLYFVLGGGKAIRYGIGVGREGFTWAGVQSIARKAEWPDWYPPVEMIQRQPYLPRMMAGGPGNPLGARAMYLGNTAYRIHGTNAPSTIGQRVSSGCIRMLNEDVTDLYSRTQVGTKVVVLPMTQRAPAQIVRAQVLPGRISSYAPTSISPAAAAWADINTARVR
jgi:lipoprotein-anchoring transpeptidase ErfK/SrfK